MKRQQVTLEYAAEWYLILNEALTAIREGQTWNCEGTYAHRFENGVIASREVYRDEIRDGVSRLLSRVGRHIRQCAGNGCPNLFVPNRKQRYCSPRCSSRT